MIKEQYRLKKLAKLAESGPDVLDLGCTALPNPFLNNERVIGLDITEGTLTPNYTELIIGSVMDIDSIFEESEFDSIVAGEIIEHLETPILFLRKCNSILKSGGRLVLSTPNPNSIIERTLTLTLSRRYYYTKDHTMLFPQRWLIRMLEISGFEDVNRHSGGIIFPFLPRIQFPRPWFYQTIAVAEKK
ncbi:MAG: class I SAM-dependent methyltransferase [FCB group bacterium]|nr:class I SAM-dependent methyltransferase [FCB group bacterium]